MLAALPARDADATAGVVSTAGTDAAAAAAADAADPSTQVTIGTSAMAVSDPHLIHSITEMVNHSYYHALKELLPPSQTSYERLSEEDVTDRLEMGDAGARANRVLHLAFRGDTLVGCCSSTYQPPWTPEGCGHWGLLVVDRQAQGCGVASAIVRAAEAQRT